MRGENERVTVTMSTDTAACLRATVAAGGAASVSAYVADAVRDRLAREEALRRLRAFTGGPPTPEAQAWAERALGVTAGDPGIAAAIDAATAAGEQQAS